MRALYAQQIKQGYYSERAVHLGYLLIGSILKLFSPDFSDRSLNLLSCAFGSGTLVVVFLLALKLLGHLVPAVFASFVLFANWVFVENSLYAEV